MGDVIPFDQVVDDTGGGMPSVIPHSMVIDDTAPQSSGMETLTGGLADITNKMLGGSITDNFGTKLIGAGAGLTDYLGAKLASTLGYDVNQPGLFDAAANRTNQISDLIGAYHGEHPTSSSVNNLAMLGMPLGGATDLTGLAAQGGALSALSAFKDAGGQYSDALHAITGDPLQGNPDAILAAAKSGGLGAVLSTALGAGLGYAGDKLSAASDAVAPLTPEEQALAALKINRSDVAKAAKFRGVNDAGEAPIQQAINGVSSRGLFEGDIAPGALQDRNNQLMDSIAAQIHGDSGILPQVDAALSAQVNPPTSSGSLIQDAVNAIRTNKGQYGEVTAPAIDTTLPSLDRAQAFIANHPFQADTLQNQLDKRLATLTNEWDGTVTGLSKLKTQIGRPAFTGLTDSKELDQAVYQDLRNAIEARANQASPGLGDQVRNLNSQLSEHYTMRPILKRAADNEIANGFKQATPASIGDILSSALKGGAGGGGLGLLGHAVGVSGLGPSGIVLGALGLGAKTALNNPTVQSKLSSLLGASSQGASTLSSLSPLLSALMSKGVNMSTPPKTAAPLDIRALVKQQPPIIQAIIHTENDKLDPKAVSPTGPVGLMQLGRHTAENLGVKDRTDPVQNIQGGTKLYNQLLDKYKDQDLAVVAYNQGEPVIDAALKRAKAEGRPQTFEGIRPYLTSEGQKYPETVARNLTKITSGLV